MGDEFEERIKNVFTSVFDTVKPEDVIFDGKHEEFDEWDSLTHMNLVSALEEEFGISLSVDDISEMDTVTRVLETVKRLLKQKGG
jgi:acyl carrier protein